VVQTRDLMRLEMLNPNNNTALMDAR